MKTTLFTLALLLAVFAVGCSGNGPVAADGSSSSAALARAIDDGGNIRSGRIEGIITAVNVDKGGLTILTSRGTAVTTLATGSTKIERNGFHVSLKEFRIGDRGQSRFDPATMNASKMEATGN